MAEQRGLVRALFGLTVIGALAVLFMRRIREEYLHNTIHMVAATVEIAFGTLLGRSLHVISRTLLWCSLGVVLLLKGASVQQKVVCCQPTLQGSMAG